MSQDVMLTVMSSTAVFGNSMNLEMKKSETCNKCLDFETKLVKRKNMVERDVYTELSKSFSKLEKHCISLELAIQFNQQIFQKDKSCDNQNAPEFPEYFENNDLKAQLQEKDTTINKLKNHIKSLRETNYKDKVKQDMDEIKTINIELEHNLKGQIQEKELLVYVSKTCPGLTKPSEKLVAVTPLNKNKKVRFAEPVTLQSNTKQQVGSRNTPDSNKPMLTSIGLKRSTSASRSHPSGNTKSNRTLRPTSSIIKNKVEDHPRSVKSKSKKVNRVVEPIFNADVKHSMLNANSELICATCNKCMFDAIHDMCVLDFVKDVNVHSKSKSAKSNKKQNVWKRTGKVFTDIGYRFNSTKVVPLKETTSKSVETQKPEIKVYSRRPKPIKSVGSSSKSKIVGSRISNTTESNQSWGSNASDVPPSPFLVNFRLSKLFSGIVRFDNNKIAKIIGCGDYQLGNVTISRVYYVEGLSHNLFFIRQFCDFNLEVSFRKHTGHICDLDGVDLLNGSRTPYELLHNKKPNLSYIHVFGALCYPTNDSEDLGKLQPKADIRIFVGYALAKKAS
ncbi:hypothetical protein Tco_1273491 [Tanacetum coccineum]